MEARPTFLNLTLNLNSLRLQQPAKPSPAGSKLGLRMTTLHEEPLRQRTLPEEPEENYNSDSEFDYETRQEKSSQKSKTKSKLSSSKTMDSLMDFAPSNNIINFVTTTTTTNNIKTNQGLVTPSMSSSASSGYGSQAVSCSNLTNDDTLSLRSMSVDETPDFDRSTSTSPPNNYKSSQNVTTPYTPSGQKRFNPFMKDIVTPDEPAVQKPLTPTKQHPLQDLTESKRNSSSDDDFEAKIKQTTDINENNHEKLIEENHNSNLSSDENLYKNDSPYESSGVVKTPLPPGKVVRRKKTSTTTTKSVQQAHRASFPLIKQSLTIAQKLEQQMVGSGNDTDSSDRLDDENYQSKKIEAPIPDWVIVGESVLIRPTSISGVVSFVGPTHFQGGTWVGVELDTPTGKNDGTVQGNQYFVCKAKHGIFVRADKLIQDKRGKGMRTYKAAEKLKAEGSLTRSRSRGDSLNTVGTTQRK